MTVGPLELLSFVLYYFLHIIIRVQSYDLFVFSICEIVQGLVFVSHNPLGVQLIKYITGES